MTIDFDFARMFSHNNLAGRDQFIHDALRVFDKTSMATKSYQYSWVLIMDKLKSLKAEHSVAGVWHQQLKSLMTQALNNRDLNDFVKTQKHQQ